MPTAFRYVDDAPCLVSFAVFFFPVFASFQPLLSPISDVPIDKSLWLNERLHRSIFPCFTFYPSPTMAILSPSLSTVSTSPETVANRPTGHLREGREVGHRHDRQEEVPCPRRPHRRPVRLRHPEAHQAFARKGHLHLRRCSPAPNRCPHEQHLRGAQGRRWVCYLFSCLLPLSMSSTGLCDRVANPALTRFLYITYSGENTFGDFEEIA